MLMTILVEIFNAQSSLSECRTSRRAMWIIRRQGGDWMSPKCERRDRLMRSGECRWPRRAAPAHQKVFQDIFSISRCKFLVTNLAVKWITQIGWSWHTDELVPRTTSRAGEILVRSAPIHGVFMWFKSFQENV